MAPKIDGRSARRRESSGGILSFGHGALEARRSGGQEVEISVPRGRKVRLRGVIVHEAARLEAIDLACVDAIAVTTATRTLIDIAAVVEGDVVEEALDDALRRRLTNTSLLRRRFKEVGEHRPGSTVLRRLIAARAETGAVPESPLETRFLRLLRRGKLPLPASQYEIRDRGRVLARVDFAYPDARLAIEVDSYRWHSGRARWEHDLRRRNALTSLGWRVVHLTSTDLDERANEVLGMIAGVLDGRAPG